jgi:hypothetical protein
MRDWMQRVISGRTIARACSRALVGGNLIAAAIRKFVRFAAIVRDFPLVPLVPLIPPAREPRDLSRKIFKPVGDRDKILADQIKIVVFEVSV